MLALITSAHPSQAAEIQASQIGSSHSEISVEKKVEKSHQMCIDVYGSVKQTNYYYALNSQEGLCIFLARLFEGATAGSFHTPILQTGFVLYVA